VGEIQTTLGRALRAMLQGVTISGNFTGRLQAGSGRRSSDQAEIVTPRFSERAHPLSSPKSRPHIYALTGNPCRAGFPAPARPKIV